MYNSASSKGTAASKDKDTSPKSSSNHGIEGTFLAQRDTALQKNITLTD